MDRQRVKKVAMALSMYDSCNERFPDLEFTLNPTIRHRNKKDTYSERDGGAFGALSVAGIVLEAGVSLLGRLMAR